jgi:hypothetical protein
MFHLFLHFTSLPRLPLSVILEPWSPTVTCCAFSSIGGLLVAHHYTVPAASKGVCSVQTFDGSPQLLLFKKALPAELQTLVLQLVSNLFAVVGGDKEQLNLGVWKRMGNPFQETGDTQKHRVTVQSFLRALGPVTHWVSELYCSLFPTMRLPLETLASASRKWCVTSPCPFTTVTVNRGRASGGEPHAHGNNARGYLQLLLCAGCWSGGELRLPLLFSGKGVPLQPGDVVAFDGSTLLHGVEEFSGTRVSLVYFMDRGAELVLRGVVPPTTGHLESAPYPEPTVG